MDFCSVIQQRLRELDREQRDLAAAAEVTESYIAQLLSRKQAPPATSRTDIYERMNAFLKLPKGRLSAMADAQTATPGANQGREGQTTAFSQHSGQGGGEIALGSTGHEKQR